MVAIETEGLTRTFRQCEAVRSLDLQVPSGSTFALIGPNGAGKTTTIKLLTNLLTPTAGRARVLGTDSRYLGPGEWQRIGYVSENQQLPEWMSPSQLLAWCRPFYPSWDAAFATALARRLGLESDAPLRTLSRGTRMKAALLSALAFRPELVILDEPFSGLDPLVREELIGALLEAPAGQGWTVLVSSHDVDEVERLADWVGFMADGRLILAEPVEQLLRRHRLVEVVGTGDAPPQIDAPPGWLVQGARDARCVSSTRATMNGRRPGGSRRCSPGRPWTSDRSGFARSSRRWRARCAPRRWHEARRAHPSE